MKKKSYRLTIISLFLFLVLFYVGFLLASHRPVWNDEIYSLTGIIRQSYGSIVLGRIQEGNNSPLFYLIQKIICSVSRYSTPQQWTDGDWGWRDPYSEILLRINPIIFMSLSIAIIFHFFSRRYSMVAGIYSLFVSLSSYMVWAYWVDARPYALWIFMTTIQSLFFLNIVHEGKVSNVVGEEGASDGQWKRLIAVHFFLSLTSIFSIAQIAIVSSLLWFQYGKKWQRYVPLAVIPSALCLFYYARAPKYQFWFKETPLQLINASIPKDRLLFIALFLGFVILGCYMKRINLRSLFKNGLMRVSSYYLALTILMIFAASLVLFIFKLTETPTHAGFQISNRYFIYLTPVGIIATTLFSIAMINSVTGKMWVQTMIIGGIGYLLFLRCLQTLALVRGFYCF